MYLEEDPLPVDIFQEPEGFYKPEAPATFTQYTLLSGQIVDLRLVGHNPLWGHLLWNGATFLTQHIEKHPELVKDKNVLELGAGAGLPSLVAGILGASKIVVTDYPDADLIENLQYNINHCDPLHAITSPKCNDVLIAKGHLFGADCRDLFSDLHPSRSGPAAFDTLLLADLIFNHSEHKALIKTIVATLAKTRQAAALVYFAPYRPLLFHKDLAFFDLAKQAGLEVQKIEERVMDKDPFPTERGNPMLRRTIFGYKLSWIEDSMWETK